MSYIIEEMVSFFIDAFIRISEAIPVKTRTRFFIYLVGFSLLILLTLYIVLSS